MNVVLHLLPANPALLGTSCFVVASLVVLCIFARFAVDAAAEVARYFGMSDLLIGLTIVSIGTSLPEIFLNIAAGLQQEPVVGLGNVIGSCFGQITVILGITILIAGEAKVERSTVRGQGPILLLGLLLPALLGWRGHLSRTDGIVLTAVYVLYLVIVSVTSMRKKRQKGPNSQSRGEIVSSMLVLSGSLLMVYLSAEIGVYYGVHLGELLGISKELIGIAAGLGTSMPELAVSTMALRRGNPGMSVGNLIGSNLTDPFLSLGLGLLVSDYVFVPSVLFVPWIFWVGGTLLALAFMWSGRKLARVEGVLLVAVFGAYVTTVIA